MSKLAAAEALVAKGFKIFPIAAGAKAPPLINDWPARAGAELAFWKVSPEDNIGIHCEGLLVIDVDVHKGGHESFQLLRLTEVIPDSLAARTPSGGRHIYYRLPAGHPGVRNSVSALGKGLDVRSTHGYVVAPGSVVPAGAYAFEDPTVEIASAPAWLVDRVGVGPVKSKPASDTDSVPDAPEEVIDRAVSFLAGQTPAYEGQGGDAHTYAVVCGLRDVGVSRIQAFGLLQEDWNQRCEPPWDLDDLWVKVVNAYRYAQNEPAAKMVTASAFSAVPAASVVVPKSSTRTLSLKEVAGKKRKPYLLKGYLSRGTFAQIYGAPGEGKTFVALDMAYHVAAGLEWMGCKVKQGAVLYIAYEGSLEDRTKALIQKYGNADVPLRFVEHASFNLRDLAGRQELGAVIAELPEKPAFIVIDTFARAMMGGDENSAQDVGAFAAAISSLIEATGACVLIVHHSGKNKAAGARGSSALRAALDTSIEIDSKQIVTDKQKEGKTLIDIRFDLKVLDLGKDEDGDVETSCVVERAQGSLKDSRPMGGKAEHVFAILGELTGPENQPVARKEWVQACIEDGMSKSTACLWVRKLAMRGRVMIEGDMVRRGLR